MNTERASYSAEDSESDDSAAVSFGSGPAFRPVPRIERPAPPEPKPEAPARVTVPEGLLFSRAHETIQANQAHAAEKKDDDKDIDDDEDASTAPTRVTSTAPAKRQAGPKPPQQPNEALQLAAPAPEADTEQVLSHQPETQADVHIPDLGEFKATLPEIPPIPDTLPSRPAAEQAPAEHPSLPAAENEKLTRTFPAETAADLPEWPEETPDTTDPPLPPVPPRQSPALGQHGQFEAPPSSVVDADEVVYATAPPTATGLGTGGSGGGGGRPPVPPAGAAGGMPPGNQPPHNHNAYFGMNGYHANTVGGGGGGYNPNAAPAPNMQPQQREVLQPIIQKKGSMWPYVAVLAENIARKRADRKLKKEMSARMDQQEQAQETSYANQLRLERQQQEMLNNQRQQTVREARRPSGNEWGVPQPIASAGEARVPGQRMQGEREPISGVVGQPEQTPMTPLERQSAEQPAELTERPVGRERHSAWHTYYEDESGRQIPGIEYGQGFQQEQKEIIQDHAGDNTPAGAAGVTAAGRSGGGSGGAGAGPSGSYYGQASGQSYQQPQPYQPTLPSGMTASSLPQGSHLDPQHQLPEHTKKSSMPGPLFWLMVSLIIIAFFAAALI